MASDTAAGCGQHQPPKPGVIKMGLPHEEVLPATAARLGRHELRPRLALAWAGYHDNVTEPPVPQRAYDEADDWLWIIARAGLRLVDDDGPCPGCEDQPNLPAPCTFCGRKP